MKAEAEKKRWYIQPVVACRNMQKTVVYIRVLLLIYKHKILAGSDMGKYLKKLPTLTYLCIKNAKIYTQKNSP